MSLVIVGGLLMTVIYTLNYNLGIAERQFAVTDLVYLAKQKIGEMETYPRDTQGRFPAPYEGLDYETKVTDSPFAEIREISVVVGNGKDRVALSELIPKSSASQQSEGAK